MDDCFRGLFLGLDGLKMLVQEMRGNENIHVGIRPYGFHGGNALALVSYPYLLCKLYADHYGKQPDFHFFISINDWEQDALDGPDYRKYPFNIYPKNTSIQYLRYTSTSGKEYSMVEYWEPVVKMALTSQLREFSAVRLSFIRNSSLKVNPVFQDFLLRTLSDPMGQSEIFRQYSGKELLKKPLSYAGIICPFCKRAHGETMVIDKEINLISWNCFDCVTKNEGRLEKFDYWWYHKPLLIARLKVFDIDITLSGGDHFSEGDYMIRKRLIEYFDKGIKVPKMLFTPTLLSPTNGERMSKSQGNHVFVDLPGLIKFSGSCGSQEFLLPKELIMDVSDDEYEEYCRSL